MSGEIRCHLSGEVSEIKHLLGERELDICLMRRARRSVYRGGYIQFANLTYQGEHLAGYAGEWVVVRYDPRDITTILIYQAQGAKDMFLTRAHAQGLETETLSYGEAQAISRRIRQAGKAINNRLLLEEVRDRDETVKQLQRQKQARQTSKVSRKSTPDARVVTQPKYQSGELTIQASTLAEPVTEVEDEVEEIKPKKPVPYVRVYDYEQLKREAGLL